MPMNPAPTLLAGLAPGAYSAGARRSTPPSRSPMTPMTPDQRAHAGGNDMIDSMVSQQKSALDELPSGAELNTAYRPMNPSPFGTMPGNVNRVQRMR